MDICAHDDVSFGSINMNEIYLIKRFNAKNDIGVNEKLSLKDHSLRRKNRCFNSPFTL